jgi:hypothetical protein
MTLLPLCSTTTSVVPVASECRHGEVNVQCTLKMIVSLAAKLQSLPSKRLRSKQGGLCWVQFTSFFSASTLDPVLRKAWVKQIQYQIIKALAQQHLLPGWRVVFDASLKIFRRCCIARVVALSWTEHMLQINSCCVYYSHLE